MAVIGWLVCFWFGFLGGGVVKMGQDVVTWVELQGK